MAQLIQLGGVPVNEGERRVIALLAEKLPANYVLVPNLECADAQTGQVYEYDAVCVAPHAVYALEIKDWNGTIEGDAWEWLVNGQSRAAPTRAIEHKAKVLKSRLASASPALSGVWVEGAVLLASDPASLKLSPEVAARTMRAARAVHWLQDAAAIHRSVTGIAALQNLIVQTLSGSFSARRGPRRFGSYEVIEPLEQTEDEAVYRARHVLFPSAPVVRLRVVTLSPYQLSPQERAKRQSAIAREAEALHKLGPHPNIAGAREMFPDEGGRLVVVFDEPAGRSLRSRLSNGTPLTAADRLSVLIDLARALAFAHEGGVIHRQVEPSSVLIAPDGTARLSNFGLAKLPLLEGNVPGATVWREPGEAGLDQRYLATELLNPRLLWGGALTPAADLWSWGCVAYEMFGTFQAPPPTLASEMVPFGADAPPGLWEIVSACLVREPSGRLADGAALLGRVKALMRAKSAPKAARLRDEYERDEVIGNRFVVRSRLGSGGFSSVYRVFDPLQDQEMALKIFMDRDGGEKLQREIQTLLRLPAHPNLVRAIWGDLLPEGHWYLATEFVDGEPLSDYAAGRKRLSPRRAVDLTLQLLGALEAIHRPEEEIEALRQRRREVTITEEENRRLGDMEASGVIHRDIKPQNLMLSGSGIKLIDFNIASRQGDARMTGSGTMPYMPPTLGQVDSATWDADPDLFATGVVLYELLCCEHPHLHADPRVNPQPRNPRDINPDISSELAEFLLRALAPTREARFHTARQMRLALEAVSPLLESERAPQVLAPPDPDPQVLAPTPEPLNPAPQAPPQVLAPAPTSQNAGAVAPTEPGELPASLQARLATAPRNVNPLVREFLGLSSQARLSNKSTRGMDDLARAIYVDTQLDQELARSVLEGRHQLVIISGNAGDGKTAFIQQVEKKAEAAGAQLLSRTENQGRLLYGEREIWTLYDGSQDEGDRKSDQILLEFLAPYHINASASTCTGASTRLAAINEGRLRDFLLTHRDEFGAFARDIIAALDDPSSSLPGEDVVLVNLNGRSVSHGGGGSAWVLDLRWGGQAGSTLASLNTCGWQSSQVHASTCLSAALLIGIPKARRATRDQAGVVDGAGPAERLDVAVQEEDVERFEVALLEQLFGLGGGGRRRRAEQVGVAHVLPVVQVGACGVKCRVARQTARVLGQRVVVAPIHHGHGVGRLGDRGQLEAGVGREGIVVERVGVLPAIGAVRRSGVAPVRVDVGEAARIGRADPDLRALDVGLQHLVGEGHRLGARAHVGVRREWVGHGVAVGHERLVVILRVLQEPQPDLL